MTMTNLQTYISVSWLEIKVIGVCYLIVFENSDPLNFLIFNIYGYAKDHLTL